MDTKKYYEHLRNDLGYSKAESDTELIMLMDEINASDEDEDDEDE